MLNDHLPEKIDVKASGMSLTIISHENWKTSLSCNDLCGTYIQLDLAQENSVTGRAMLDIADERIRQMRKEFNSKHDAADVVGYQQLIDARGVEQSSRENLVKAAALLVAEIERIDREEQGNACIFVSSYFSNDKTMRDIVELVNGGSCEFIFGVGEVIFTSNELAGQYAYEAWKESGNGQVFDEDTACAHLETLEDEGASFDYSKAVAHAMRINDEALS